MKGYALIAALEAEANEIATERRAELVRDAARAIRELIEENRQLLDLARRLNARKPGQLPPGPKEAQQW